MKTYYELAIQAAIDGGKAIMEVYSTHFDVEIKEDNSPLTEADKNANTIINEYLARTPFPIISEENRQIEYSERKNWESCWIVDPLDGTKEFIKRNGEFTVNIALVTHGNPIFGVIYVPVSKTLYFTADDASRAYKMVLDSTNESVHSILTNAEEIYPEREIPSTIKIVGSRSHLNEDTAAFISEIEKEHKVEIVSKGSSLKFCLVAEGLANIYPRFAPTMEWDTAAGQAICQAVGLDVIDNNTGKPLRYNKEDLLNPYFLLRS